MKHAELGLGGSSAKRTMSCLGWRREAKKLPESMLDTENAYTREGTALHHIMEMSLRGESPTVDDIVNGVYVTLDMLERAQIAADTLSAYLKSENLVGRPMLVEEKVDLQLDGHKAWGTVDLAVLGAGRLSVIDWKFGQGVMVDAKDNDQLIFYAAGLIRTKPEFEDLKRWPDSTPVDLVIIQPGLNENNRSVWTTTIGEALEWADRYEKTLVAGDEPNSPLKRGDWCRFCPVKPVCPTMSKEVELVMDIVEQAVTDTRRTIPWSEMLAKAELLEGWVKAVKVEAEKAAMRGEKIDGYKLVERFGHRTWVDEDAVKVRMKRIRVAQKDYMINKIKSPAQIEKLLKGTRYGLSYFDHLIYTKSHGYSLVPEADEWPAVEDATETLKRIEDHVNSNS